VICKEDIVAKKVIQIEELNDLKIVMINAYDLPEEMVEVLKQSGYIVDIMKKDVSVKNSLIEMIESF
jgi:ribosomal protein S8